MIRAMPATIRTIRADEFEAWVTAARTAYFQLGSVAEDVALSTADGLLCWPVAPWCSTWF
jgi:hypothetical protein